MSKQGDKKVGVTGAYQYEVPVDPEQVMICGRTGIEAKFKDLTDAQIETMIKAGNVGFTKLPVKTKS